MDINFYVKSMESFIILSAYVIWEVWESKMCRLALQLLGMLGNVLGLPRHALQGSWPTSACFCKVLGVPHRRETPRPTCCLISCEVKGVVYHQVSYIEAWWYTTLLALQLIRQQVREFLFDVGRLGPCRSMPRSAKDLAKHAEVGRGRCQACQGVAKQAYTS